MLKDRFILYTEFTRLMHANKSFLIYVFTFTPVRPKRFDYLARKQFRVSPPAFYTAMCVKKCPLETSEKQTLDKTQRPKKVGGRFESY